VALAGLAFTALAGFIHWITAGPNEVQPEDEAEAQRLLRPAKAPRPSAKGQR
jgi:formate dehydrogenase iron-sulfur subunit